MSLVLLHIKVFREAGKHTALWGASRVVDTGPVNIFLHSSGVSRNSGRKKDTRY